MTKSNARQFETLGSKLQMLRNVSNYDWANDYVKQQEETVNNITVAQIRDLARKYLNPDNMYYVVVGDAATQLDRLKEVGFGDPVLLNEKE